MKKMGAPDAAEGRTFHTLDALRGLAAVGVVMFHMSAAFAPAATPGGYLAVDLFFMMSGVVLSHAYEARFEAGMGVFDFMRARLIRLYPLYLLATLFGLAVTLASLRGRNIMHWDVPSLARAASLALLFLPNLSASPVNQLFPLNIPCWSLFLEILVNLLFVVSWPLLTSRRLIATSLLAGGAVAFAIARHGSIDLGSDPSTIVVGLIRTVFGFSVGVLIARRIRHSPRRTGNFRVMAILAAVGILIGGWPHGIGRPIWDALSVLVAFPLIVYWGTVVDPGRGLRSIATFLGVTSYAVYVLHSPLSSVLNSVTRHFAGAGGAPFTGIVILLVLLGVCWLVDRYFDMPVRRHLSRMVPKMRTFKANES